VLMTRGHVDECLLASLGRLESRQRLLMLADVNSVNTNGSRK